MTTDDTPDREHALGEWRTTRHPRPCLSPRDCADIPAGATGGANPEEVEVA
jgi:hypothetical protein